MDKSLLRLLEWGGEHLVRGCLPLLLVCPLFLTGCAKTGEPHPPAVLVPKPAADLVARQYSDQVLLAFSMPAQNTDGSPVDVLGSIEIWRRTDERTNKAFALTDPEFLKGAEKIQSIAADKISAFQRDKMILIRDDLAFADRSSIYSKEFRYAVRFVNRKRQSAGLSNQSIVAPVPIPPPPRNLSAEVTQDFIRLKWAAPAENMDGSVPPRIAGYNIYRTEDPKNFPAAPLNHDLVSKPEFEDRDFVFDKTYYYSVSIVGSRENPYGESLASAALALLPRDTFPPGAPQNLNGVAAGPAVLLLWAAPPERDVAGYRVYRREDGETAPRLLQQELVKALSYRDEKVQQSRKYSYRVTAVDTYGNEGPAAEAEVEIQ